MKTILMIHGWDYENYTNRCKNYAWSNRKLFINKLSEKFNVIYLNLPGFGGEPEPKEKSWNLDDFSKYIDSYIKQHHLKIDYILGYSFGGAVATRYKLNVDNKIKLILISPAIIRNNDKSKKFIKTPRFLDVLRVKIRDIYLIYYIKNPEMKYGTKFLRATYQNIVRLNLISEINTFDSKDILIIYGSNDNMVNPNSAIKYSSSSILKNVKFIEGGGHDIANTHTNELVAIISKFIGK